MWFLCIVRAYHGHTAALIDISPYKFNHLGEKGKKDFIHVAPTPDPYRGIFQGEATPELGEKYALEVKKLIDQAHKDGRKVPVIRDLGHMYRVYGMHDPLTCDKKGAFVIKLTNEKR